MKAQLYILSMILAGSALAGSTLLSGPRLEIACQAELLHGNGPRLLQARSAPFAASAPLSADPVRMQVGPYTLVAEIQIVGRFEQRPELTMNFFDGHPIGNSLFNARTAGFEAESVRSPVTLGGYQFRNVSVDGVQYTRIDYQCSLQRVE